MQHLKITLLSILLSSSILNISLAQINGNSQIKTLKLEAATISQLHANFPIELILDNSQTAQLELTTDENVLAALKINSNGKKISILQEEWVEPTQMVQVKGSLPALNQLKVQGYGKVFIENLQVLKFDLQIPVGTAELSGQTDEINISTKTGSVNALNLINKKATVTIKSFGTVQINTEQILKTDLAKDATLVYSSKPQEMNQNVTGRIMAIDAYQKETLPKVEYVNIKLKNNKRAKIDTYVKGPKQKRFSYGIPFKGKQSRTEHWPIGTKLYLVNSIGMRKLLYTVTQEDADQTVDLFSR